MSVLVISATSNSILDRAIDSEEAQHKDFLRLVGYFKNSFAFCIKFENLTDFGFEFA